MGNNIFESKKFIDLMKDEKFIEEMSNKKTREEIKNLFLARGVEMTDENLDQFAKDLEQISIGNVSGGKKFSEAAGDFIHEHPYLSCFLAIEAVQTLGVIVFALKN